MRTTGTEPNETSVVRNFRITAVDGQPVGVPYKFKRNAHIRETSKTHAEKSGWKMRAFMKHESRAAADSGVQDE
jgi:hypothetical protein